MEENQTLRGLLRSVAGFIGEGAGGFLPRLGWQLEDFNNFINRSETDTVYESHKKLRMAAINSNEGPSTDRSSPRPSDRSMSRNASTVPPPGGRNRMDRPSMTRWLMAPDG